jgi:HSP20 family protein
VSVFHWNSLQDLFAIQEKMNRLFEETIHRSEFPEDGLEAAFWSPAADVFETQDEIILQVELPGILLEDVRLEALDGRIKVVGHRRPTPGVEPRHFVRMERIYGTFSREFAVPASIDPALIKASLRAGVLRVTAPKSDKAQPISVEKKKAR